MKAWRIILAILGILVLLYGIVNRHSSDQTLLRWPSGWSPR
jgi:hypothetical protein